MFGMKRREFIALVGGAAAWPLAARAQQPERMRRVGVLMSLPQNDPGGQAEVAAFYQGLAALGWVEGRNIRVEFRWPGGDVGVRGPSPKSWSGSILMCWWGAPRRRPQR